MNITTNEMKEKMELLNKWREFVNYTDSPKNGIMGIIWNGEYPIEIKDRMIWTSNGEHISKDSILYGHYIGDNPEKPLLKIYKKNGIDDKHTKFFAETKGNPNGSYMHVFQYGYDGTPEMEVAFVEGVPVYMRDLNNLSCIYSKHKVGIYTDKAFEYIFKYIQDGIKILKSA